MKNCSLRRTPAGEVHGGLLPCEGLHARARKESEGWSPPEEEGVAETMSEELETAPIPSTPVLLGGKEVEKIMRKLSLGIIKE